MDLKNSSGESSSTNQGATDDEGEEAILLELWGTPEITKIHEHTGNGNEEHLLLDYQHKDEEHILFDHNKDNVNEERILLDQHKNTENEEHLLLGQHTDNGNEEHILLGQHTDTENEEHLLLGQHTDNGNEEHILLDQHKVLDQNKDNGNEEHLLLGRHTNNGNEELEEHLLLDQRKYDGNEEHLLLDLGGITEIQVERASSTSSSSSSSSDEDFIQLDGKELENPSPGSEEAFSDTSSPLPSIDAAEIAPELTFHVHSVESIKMPKLDEDASFQDDFDMHEAKQSPLTQVMIRTDVPDPFRIPSSVFQRNKSTAPMEWSVASNESLFSIHMGTDSFSRDHAILFDMSTELPGLPLLVPPPLMSGTTNSGEVKNDILKDSFVEKIDDDKTPAESSRPTTSQSYHSDSSPSSTNSFAFPILTEGHITSMKVERDRYQSHHQSLRQRPTERKESKKQDVIPTTTTWRSWFTCYTCFHCC